MDDETSGLYLTTRDISSPRTGADNRSKYLRNGLYREFSVDSIYFTRTENEAEIDDSVSIEYPRSETFAILSIRFIFEVLKAIQKEEYDFILASGIGAATYGILATLLSDSIFIFDDHNVEYEVARDRSLPRFVVVYILERLACHLATVVTVPTKEVKTVISPWVRGDVRVISNGYDADTFSPTGEGIVHGKQTLLFFGNLSYKPNVEGVKYIINCLCPYISRNGAEAKVILAGPGCNSVKKEYSLPDEVEVLGFVDDLPATIRGADVVIVPLLSGSGSRLKIIESLACGTRVVSTTIGAEGWPSNWENLVIADLDEFAETVLETLESPEFDTTEYEQISKYSWKEQAGHLADAIRSKV